MTSGGYRTERWPKDVRPSIRQRAGARLTERILTQLFRSRVDLPDDY
ncbi:hypothetical protein I546_2719 [Mycobacterium kansasii 732]|nr:hypothetical protein I546_2719 [Mycobacterium kansasii 732]